MNIGRVVEVAHAKPGEVWGQNVSHCHNNYPIGPFVYLSDRRNRVFPTCDVTILVVRRRAGYILHLIRYTMFAPV